ncbi:LPXTG cell wall anchor domain-containing protein [Plantactinospora endophytica]|uniref:Gram-positive cocci surface proteins LPxTG domain-containing protein n=1 Tax=Plantactinospora endophytica TaxID=673535 RepID=A0ABQ4E8Z3_9ACTN|nr:LPXTG cell wall anchor domain-containing protein [Plantactinospora endophytica]GIG91200.1 hypothetical protein Pen02_61360 [Plantactinospora endophytica]
MRGFRIAAAIALAAGGLAVGASPASAAADTTAPVLGDITVTHETVAVAGLDLVPVTIAVELTDESGVKVVDESGEMRPGIVLSREGGPTPADRGISAADLKLTSGTEKDGVWSATVHVPSTWDGRWQLSQVIAVDTVGNRLDVDPRTVGKTRTLQVDGTNLPAVTLRFTPDPVVGNGPLTIEGRFHYTDTGEGIANQPILLGVEGGCVEGRAKPNLTTRADGTFSKVESAPSRLTYCVGILRPPTKEHQNDFIVITSEVPRIKPAVTVAASETTVAPGTKVTFTGTAVPAVASKAELQVQEDSTWRTVDSGDLESLTRFTLDATQQEVGTYRYRVVVPDDDPDLVGISETITVEVTESGGGGAGGGTLPITGAPLSALLIGGAVLLVGGAGLVVAGRRRRAPVTASED